MTTPASNANAPGETDTTGETEPASSLQTAARQAAGEVARGLPPMTAEQAALVRHLLRDQHH